MAYARPGEGGGAGREELLYLFESQEEAFAVHTHTHAHTHTPRTHSHTYTLPIHPPPLMHITRSSSVTYLSSPAAVASLLARLSLHHPSLLRPSSSRPLASYARTPLLAAPLLSRPHLVHHRHFARHVPCHLYHAPLSPCQLRSLSRPRHFTSPVLSNPLHPHTRTAPCLISRPTRLVSSSRPLRSYHHVPTSLSLLSRPSACSSFPFRVTRPPHPLVTSPHSARGAGLGPPPRPARGPARQRRQGALVTSLFQVRHVPLEASPPRCRRACGGWAVLAMLRAGTTAGAATG